MPLSTQHKSTFSNIPNHFLYSTDSVMLLIFLCQLKFRVWKELTTDQKQHDPKLVQHQQGANAAPFWWDLWNTHGPCQVAKLLRQMLTQVVVDKLSWEGRLLMLPAPVQAGAGIRGVHRENVCADPHQFCLPHQLPDGWSTGGQRSWELLPWDPCLWPCVPGQLGLCPVLLQAGGDPGLQTGHACQQSESLYTLLHVPEIVIQMRTLQAF